MPIVSPTREIEALKSKREKTRIEAVLARLQDLRAVCTQNEWKIDELNYASVVTKHDQGQIIFYQPLFLVGVAGDERLSLINDGKPSCRPNFRSKNLVLSPNIEFANRLGKCNGWKHHPAPKACTTRRKVALAVAASLSKSSNSSMISAIGRYSSPSAV